MRPVLLPVAALLLCASPVSAAPDWSAVDVAFGRAGAEQPGGVHRYSFPRSDLTVTLDGVVLKPALALGSWAAFHDMGDRTEVMGDLVLRQEEVNPVLSRLLAGGLTITALHNHLLRSTPATMYMHIHGEGDPARLAAVVRSALALSGTPLGPPPPAAAGPPLAFDTAAIDAAMGAKGKAAGGVYQFSLPRAEQITEAGMPVPPSMGLATAVNFQPSGAGKAAITGDFVLIESEVAPVLKALRDNGIDVTALHNHLGQEQPRLFFMHFWANADAVSLARGIRHALDRTNLARAAH
jgi:hypothetical protein